MNTNTKSLESKIAALEKQLQVQQDSQNLLVQVLECDTDSIYAIDFNYKLLLSNSKHQKICEEYKSISLTVGDSIFPDTISQDTCTYWKQQYNRAFKGETFLFESVSKDTNGTQYVFENTFSPLRNSEGVIYGALVVMRDITKQVTANQKVREREELLYLMGKIGHIGGWNFNVDTGEGTWTDEVALIHDMHPNDPTNKNIGLSYYKEESRQRIESAINEAINHAIPYDLELELVTAKGTPKWVRTIGLPVLENGKVVKLEGSMQDITQLKHTEINLKAAKTRLQNIINSNPETILVIDRDFIITATNGTFVNRLQLPVGEVVGHSYFDFVPNHLSQKRKEYLEKVLTSGETAQMEDVCEDLYLEHFLYPVMENGMVINVVLFIRNITERKNSEDKVNESEKQYRYLFENNPLPMWAYDVESLRFLAVNNVAVMKYGYSREEFLNMTIEDIRPVDELKKLHANLAIERELFESSEDWKHQLKDGTIIDVEIKSHLIDLDGDNASLVIALDVTEKKKAQTSLIESEGRFRQITETIQDVFWVSDIEMQQLHYISPAVESIWGFSPQHFYDNPELIYRCIHPDDRYKFTQALQLLKSGKEFTNEYRIISASGEIKHLLDRGFPVFNENSQLVRYVGVAKDLTDRKNDLEEIKKLSTAVEQSPVSILITDLESNIEYVNDYFLEQTGYNREDLIGVTPLANKPQVEDKDVYDALLKTVRAGRIWKGQLQNQKKNGDLFWENVSVTPMTNERGEVVNYLSVKTDITNERLAAQKIMKLNEELEQKVITRTAQLSETNAKLKELNATKDKFFSIIAHDLKNPFASLMLSSEMLEKLLERNEIDRAKTKARTIQESTKRGYELLDNLLQWSKLEQGMFHFNPEKLNLKEVANECITLISLSAENKKIKLVNTIDSSIHINADKNMTMTIFRNLMTNAIKFTAENGCITLHSSLQPAYVELTISDNGIGMEPSKIDKLFKVGEKVNSLGTSGETGTGLGLILCKNFIEKHRGNIWVKSEVGIGTDFKFTLPLSTN